MVESQEFQQLQATCLGTLWLEWNNKSCLIRCPSPVNGGEPDFLRKPLERGHEYWVFGGASRIRTADLWIMIPSL